jgi:hypothetical protein
MSLSSHVTRQQEDQYEVKSNPTTLVWEDVVSHLNNPLNFNLNVALLAQFSLCRLF